MNISDLRLTLVRLILVKGESFGPKSEDQTESQLRASFTSKITADLEGLEVGADFDLHLNFKAIIDDSEDPAFEAEVCGVFVVNNQQALKELGSDEGVYQAATMIFPYLRNFSKPILEALGTANIDFPYFLPTPPPAEPKRKRPAARNRAKAQPESAKPE